MTAGCILLYDEIQRGAAGAASTDGAREGRRMRRSRFLKYSCILMLLTAFVRIAFGIMMINFYSTVATFGAVEKGTLRTAGLTLFLVLACGAAELVCGHDSMENLEQIARGIQVEQTDPIIRSADYTDYNVFCDIHVG